LGIRPETVPRIEQISPNFLSWFPPVVNEPISEMTLRTQRLRTNLWDNQILSALKGLEPDIKVKELFWLLAQQPDGRSGRLMVNGAANICYILDLNGVRRAVSGRWHFQGWFLDAYPLDLAVWLKGDQIIQYVYTL